MTSESAAQHSSRRPATMMQDERSWRTYYTEMLLPHDSCSEYGTSYGTTRTGSSYHCHSKASWMLSRSTADDRNSCSAAEGTVTGKEPFNRPVTWVWVLLSISVFGVCAFALVQPYWFISARKKKTSLGVINYCVPVADEEWCSYYGDEFSVANMPSLSWRMALLLYSTGCAVLAIASLQAAFCLCIKQPHKRRISLVAGYLQLFSVILLITSLIIYPVGLDSEVARTTCDESGIYDSGSCNLGWSYALAIAGTTLSAFCPVLSHYIDYPVQPSTPT